MFLAVKVHTKFGETQKCDDNEFLGDHDDIFNDSVWDSMASMSV